MSRSLDSIEAAQFHAGSRPMDAVPLRITLQSGDLRHPAATESISLDGGWLMAPDGNRDDRIAGNFSDAIPAVVPGSVQSGLWQAGKVPDPKVGKNDAFVRDQGYQNWWFCKKFDRPKIANPRLVFSGVANKFGVFLNGNYLGQHGGMFGSWEAEIAGHLLDENLLVVLILPIPFEENIPHSHPQLNEAWRYTVTINNIYGWHYSSMPCLGIWRPVTIEEAPSVQMQPPFIAVHDLQKSEVDFAVEIEAAVQWRGRLKITIQPENFEGAAFHIEREIASDEQLQILSLRTPLNSPNNLAGTPKAVRIQTIRLRFTIPDARLWWPNGMGEPNLYRCTASFLADGDTRASISTTTFGLRTVTMSPLPGGPYQDKYNWTFVINGKPMFVKGTGWCTMDSNLEFIRDRYDRFLSLARDQHCQLLRAWGCGLPETDDFYDLCDRYGLMVMQEWPTAWNSQKIQPYVELEETVRQNTLRLRNHPSLVLWCGGNESWQVEDPVIDMMGRLSIELDGTRPFHRGEPRGGSRHDYGCWWDMKPLDYNVVMESSFWGEFGIASTPVVESVLRYLPEDEKNTWPPTDEGSFAYHTPIFNHARDLERLRLYVSYFSEGASMSEFVQASQVAQATALRHTLERARARWPHCTGALYYKLNDNYPAASWSISDWYGAPKIAHYFCQDAFAPVHACVMVSKLNIENETVALPVFLLDDHGALAGRDWKVQVRAFDQHLGLVHGQEYKGCATTHEPVRNPGVFNLSAAQTKASPLLVVVDWKSGEKQGRTFYWLNYEARKDSLFQLPTTRLLMSIERGKVLVKNTGPLPAVGVHVLRPGHLAKFAISDNYFWLDAGEMIELEASDTSGLTVSSWNHL